MKLRLAVEIGAEVVERLATDLAVEILLLDAVEREQPVETTVHRGKFQAGFIAAADDGLHSSALCGQQESLVFVDVRPTGVETPALIGGIAQAQVGRRVVVAVARGGPGTSSTFQRQAPVTLTERGISLNPVGAGLPSAAPRAA